MKDANEREIHWYEETPAMKEISENSGSLENTKCDVIGNSINSNEDEQTLTTDDEIIRLKEESDLDYISPNMEGMPDVGEPPELCKEETNDSFEEHQGCVHHDMADTSDVILQDSDCNKSSPDEQCVHSDAIKIGKTVKVNRVTPFRYADQDSGNLLIDLTDNHTPDHPKYSKLKKKDDKSAFCNAFVEDVGISQERFTTDLPRHNWLVKRLKQQNQLNEGDMTSLHTTSNDSQKKEAKNTEVGTSEFKPIEVPQLPTLLPESAQKGYDILTVVSKSLLNSEPTITDVDDTITPRSPTSPVKTEDRASDTVAICSPTTIVQESSSPQSPTKSNDQVTPRSPVLNSFVPISPVKPVTELDIKPNTVTSSPVQQTSMVDSRKCPPPLSGIALSSLKYDSLSRFNSIPKHHLQSQFYPSVCESYSSPQHNEVRNMREITRPHPLHLQDSYKCEQDVYGLNHRVRLSLTPLSNTKDRMTFRNQIMDKSTSIIKSYDTISSANLAASPEVLKRNVAIQRQLENQKRWIAEHEPYKLNAANNAAIYGEHNEGPNNPAVPSPLNPTSIPLSRFPSFRTEGGGNFTLDHTSLLQSQDYLKEKIDACNKEIREIQQQKDILFARQQGMPSTDSPSHLSIIALNRKLSSLEDYRMKQSALLMKLKSHPYDERGQAALKKTAYMNMNGAVIDSDEIQAKQRPNAADISENLLLRQLQSKHDEGTAVATKTTDSHCRTIDLSKSSEMFYNDIQMQTLRVSQPSTPMNNVAMKDYLNAGDVPPLVSAERLSPAASNFTPRKSPMSPADYPHGHALTFSQSSDIARPANLTPSSQVTDGQRSHEIIHSFKSQETLLSREIPMPRDIPHHLQYQKIARARELQHSMQVQELSRAPHDILHGAQFQDRHHPRSHSLGPHDIPGSRPHTISHQEIKSREISYSQMQANEPMHNHYSPGSLPPTQPYQDASYDDIRTRQYAKENMLKRHSGEPARPGQLKLARTSQNIMHQIHTSQMDKNFPKILQYNANMNNRMDSKYSPSNIPSAVVMTTEGSPISPYQRNAYNRYEVIAQNIPNSLNSYEGPMSQQGAVTPSYHPEKKSIRIRTCNACDKESQFLCSGCRGIWYCSRQCQLDDWKIHSKTCRKK